MGGACVLLLALIEQSGTHYCVETRECWLTPSSQPQLARSEELGEGPVPYEKGRLNRSNHDWFDFFSLKNEESKCEWKPPAARRLEECYSNVPHGYLVQYD